MYTYSNLNNTPLEQIYGSLVDAFSGYEIKIDMTIDDLLEMLRTRSYSPGHSIGCFTGNELVGFCLVGYRDIGASKCCYDIATGIVEAHQGKGIAKKMISMLKEEMAGLGIDVIYLEVLENNQAAQKVYSDQGFRVIRKLRCFTHEGLIKQADGAGHYVINDESHLETICEAEFNGFRPAWQNSVQSYTASREQHVLIVRLIHKAVAGYLIVHKASGNILQIGVAPGLQKEGIEEGLLYKAQEVLEKDSFTMANIEDGAELIDRLTNIGFVNHINQYEMGFQFYR